MEEGVSDRKNDRNIKNYGEKEAEFPDGNSPVYMEEGVSDRKMTRMKKLIRGKRQNAQMTVPLLIWRKVKVTEKMMWQRV